jgi:hypothetical protein
VCCSPFRRRKCERRTTAASGCIRHAAGALPDVKRSSYRASAPFCGQRFAVALVLGTSVFELVSRHPQGYRVFCSVRRMDASVKVVRACGLESRFQHRQSHVSGRRTASFGRPLTGVRDAGGSVPAGRKSHPDELLAQIDHRPAATPVQRALRQIGCVQKVWSGRLEAVLPEMRPLELIEC